MSSRNVGTPGSERWRSVEVTPVVAGRPMHGYLVAEIKPEPRRKSSGHFIAIRESVALMGFGEKLLTT